jgi:DNA-binding NarL/FixJ family response regulator
MSRTILIVDDHSDFRASVRRLLVDAGYEVVGEASDGASALAAARDLRPAIVLLDLDGFDVALHLTRDADPPAVVLTSIHDRDDLAGMIAHSGARGFLPKAELSAAALAEILT